MRLGYCASAAVFFLNIKLTSFYDPRLTHLLFLYEFCLTYSGVFSNNVGPGDTPYRLSSFLEPHSLNAECSQGKLLYLTLLTLTLLKNWHEFCFVLSICSLYSRIYGSVRICTVYSTTSWRRSSFQTKAINVCFDISRVLSLLCCFKYLTLACLLLLFNLWSSQYRNTTKFINVYYLIY